MPVIYISLELGIVQKTFSSLYHLPHANKKMSTKGA